MPRHTVYAEAYRRIASLIEGVDMDSIDDISGTNAGEPTDEVIDAMYAIAENLTEEANNLESEEMQLKTVHKNLVMPTS